MSDQENPSPSLRPILSRFAADSVAIMKLVGEDEGFRSLVEDYILTLNTLRRLRHQTPPNRSTIAEYASILRDLEAEVTTYLSRRREGNP